jgi:hypothetical protein
VGKTSQDKDLLKWLTKKPVVVQKTVAILTLKDVALKCLAAKKLDAETLL